VDAIETQEYKGYQINIVQDEDPEDPREWSNLGRMLCAHKRYNLGDPLDVAAPGWSSEWTTGFCNWAEIEEAIYDELDAAVCVPLYMYDHSGISISTSRTWPYDCPWDSGQIGYIYATREDILAEFGGKRLSSKLRQQVEEILIIEVNTYNLYITGQVYGYVTTDKEGETIDSCFGFYDTDYPIIEAKAYIDWVVKKRIEDHAEQVKAWILNGVPLEYRYALGIS